MSERSERLSAIRRIVRSEEVHTQQELLEALKRAGHACTQGTLSRDFGDLGLRKLKGGRYYLPEDLHLRQMLQQFALSLVPACNLLVLKTTSGTAQGVAAAFDAALLPEAIGTIAGDDTIMVITADDTAAEALAERLSLLRINA
ncbi:MAG: ArgR family transcriptional regulator [Coriobacteriales bacterium]|jgi:transcriptional regulator of arginine metabolism|nr:ArgR family transcriptional regulator [Coriobacteriales bacterium]